MSRHTYKPGDLVSIVLHETDYYYAKLLGHPARLIRLVTEHGDTMKWVFEMVSGPCKEEGTFRIALDKIIPYKAYPDKPKKRGLPSL